MKKTLFTLIYIAGIFFSCNPEDKEKALQEDVIEIHDEAMLLMDKLMRQKGRLQYKIDSLKLLEKVNEDKVEELQETIRKLRKADSAMMNWMRQFDALPADTITHEDRINYLKKEKSRIKKVHEMMVKAINRASEADNP